MKKSASGFRMKRYALLGIGIASVTVVLGATAFSRGNIRIASVLKKDPQAITVSARQKNSNNYTDVTSEDGIDVPVPKGYVASTDPEERYVNGVTTNGIREHHGGFVIYEKNAGETDEQARTAIQADITTAQKTRNQYVWVPINSAEVDENMYHNVNDVLYENTYDFSESEYTKDETARRSPGIVPIGDYDHTFLKQYLEGVSRLELQSEIRYEFYEMLTSVKTYGGFYIGRYETGNINSKMPVVIKGNNKIGNETWYDMYKRCKNLKGNNKAVETGIIWGILWDETLKWLIDSEEKTYAEVYISKSWGNYRLGTFTYTDISGNTVTKRDNASISIPTGSTEYTKANNIYDLAGNNQELTMESSGSEGRYCRGGSYNSSGNNNMRAHLRTQTKAGDSWDNVRDQGRSLYRIDLFKSGKGDGSLFHFFLYRKNRRFCIYNKKL